MQTTCHGEAARELMTADVAAEAFDRIDDGLIDELRAIARLDRSVIHRLRKMLLARILYRFDRSRPFTLECALVPRLPRRLAEEISVFAAVLSEGVEAGLLTLDNPRSMARTLMLATNSLLPFGAIALKLDRREDVARRASELIDLLLDGLVQRDWLATPQQAKTISAAC
jgi:hypothetical protein